MIYEYSDGCVPSFLPSFMQSFPNDEMFVASITRRRKEVKTTEQNKKKKKKSSSTAAKTINKKRRERQPIFFFFLSFFRLEKTERKKEKTSFSLSAVTATFRVKNLSFSTSLLFLSQGVAVAK